MVSSGTGISLSSVLRGNGVGVIARERGKVPRATASQRLPSLHVTPISQTGASSPHRGTSAYRRAVELLEGTGLLHDDTARARLHACGRKRRVGTGVRHPRIDPMVHQVGHQLGLHAVGRRRRRRSSLPGQAPRAQGRAARPMPRAPHHSARARPRRQRLATRRGLPNCRHARDVLSDPARPTRRTGRPKNTMASVLERIGQNS